MLDRVRRAVDAQLAADDVTHLAGVRVLRHVRVGVRGHDEDTRRGVRLVPDSLRSCEPAREDDHVSLREDSLSSGRPERRRAAEDDEHLLAAVVQVVPVLATRLELPDRGSERAGARAVEAEGADASPVGDLVPDVRHHAAWIGESAAGSGCSCAGRCAVVAAWFFATSMARLSRMTVTFTWPGYSRRSSISRAISWARSAASSSPTSPGLTMTLISRPAWSAYTFSTPGLDAAS